MRLNIVANPERNMKYRPLDAFKYRPFDALKYRPFDALKYRPFDAFAPPSALAIIYSPLPQHLPCVDDRARTPPQRPRPLTRRRAPMLDRRTLLKTALKAVLKATSGAALVAALSAGLPLSNAFAQVNLDQLVAAAKAEGEVVFYLAPTEPIAIDSPLVPGYPR